MSDELEDELHARFDALAVSVPLDVVRGLCVYYDLLSRWNSTMNLTGLELRSRSAETLERILVEPVLAAQQIDVPGPRVIDIGSGGGSPAIPFALAVRAEHLIMVESRTRKSVFLREAARAVTLSAEVLTARFEDVASKPELVGSFHLVTVRAVKVGPAELALIGGLLRPGGALYLFASEGTEVPGVTAGLEHTTTVGLSSRLKSELTVLRKT